MRHFRRTTQTNLVSTTVINFCR